MRFRLAAAALSVAAAAPALQAQTWRTISSARQTHGEEDLTVGIRFGAGRFQLGPGTSGTLYRMEMRYDEERFTPVRDYNPASAHLRLGVRTRGEGTRVSLGDPRAYRQPASLDVTLNPDVPIALTMELGAVESDVELGGLNIRRLEFSAGASESHIRFSSANAAECESATFQAGAASIEVTGLANANCRRVRFAGGVGEVTLDFSGAWRQPIDANVSVSIGSLRLRIPRDVGVSLRLNRFLASFERAGFIKRGDVYFSPNYDTARQRLTLDVTATFGGVDVVWIN